MSLQLAVDNTKNKDIYYFVDFDHDFDMYCLFKGYVGTEVDELIAPLHHNLNRALDECDRRNIEYQQRKSLHVA